MYHSSTRDFVDQDRMPKLRTLQFVSAWLRTTENWMGRILENLPDSDVTILSRQWIPGTFHSSRFHYIQMPMTPLQTNGQMLPRLWNGMERVLRGFEMRALAATCKGRFDILHSHFSIIGWEALDLARILDIPHLVSFYGFDYENLPFTHPFWKKRYQILFQRADRFICEGQHGGQILERMGCPSSKISICRLGVDPEKIPSLLPRRNDRNGFQLVQIAGLAQKKGQDDAIRATAIAARTLDVHLTIVGGERGVRRQDLQDLAEKEGISQRVTFLEELNFAQLHEFLLGFDAFIHPSCYSETRDCEGGAPIVLLDSQAMGLPVISTTHCDIPDEVLDGVSGFLTPERNPELLAQSILKMAALTECQYNAMRLAGRAHVLDRYDVRNNAIELERIYRSAQNEYAGPK